MGPIVPPRSIKPCRRADQQEASERKCGRVSNEQSIPHTTESHLIAMPWKMENGTFAPGSRICWAGIPYFSGSKLPNFSGASSQKSCGDLQIFDKFPISCIFELDPPKFQRFLKYSKNGPLLSSF